MDTKAPDTSITVKPASLVNVTTASLSFTGDDTGGSGVASFECRLDSNAPEAWAACISAKQYSGLTEGQHKFEVRAIDTATNADASPAIYSWQIDLTPPTVSVDSGPSGLTNDSTPTFGFGSEPAATFECSIDTGTPAFGPCSDAASHTPANPLSDGPRTFRVRATDQAGNQAVATRSFTLDATEPSTQITDKPASLVNVSTASFAFTGDDTGGSGVASFECRLDSNAPEAWATCTSPKPYADLAEGSHKFEARAVDNAGNADGTPAVYQWQIDLTPPTVSVDSGPSGLTNDSTPTFGFGSEPSATFECSIDTGTPSFAPCSSAGSHTPTNPLGDGPHTFRVRATDQAGNQAIATRDITLDATEPDTQITDKPATLVKVATASFSFSGDDTSGSGVASFECRIDSNAPEAWEACSSAKQYSGLSEGSHNFEVRAIDTAANADATPAVYSWSVDTKEPQTQIADKPASLVNAATASFSFGGEDPGGSGVASLQCRIDSAAPGDWGACTSAKQYSDLSEGSHTFEVRAIDNAGNNDASPASYSWTIDLTPPTVSVDSGPSGLTNDSTPTFGFGSEPNATFECSIDTGSPAFGPCSDVGSHTPANPLGEGPHTFRVRATDQAGNQAVATRSFTLDATEPQTQITDKPALLVNAATASFSFTGDDASGSGVASFECRLDSNAPEAWTACISAKQYSGLNEGSHKFEVRAIDTATNADSTPAVYSWNVDSKEPNTQITDTPASLANVATASFSFSGDDTGGSGIASFQCRIDSNAPEAWTACTSPTPYADLSEGSHKFEVRAIDNAGSADSTPAVYSWSVDSKAPDTQVTDKPASLVNVTTASFSFTGDDTGGSGVASLECRLDSNAPDAWAACTSAKQHSGLSEGSHKFEVRAIDQAANTDPSPATYSWQVDLTAPVVSVNSGPAGVTNDSTPTFGFGSEPGATFECSIDTGTPSFGPCSSAGSHTPANPLGDGPHTFRVRATDQAGNQAVATRGFLVDTAAPQAPELSATVPASPANENNPKVLGSALAGTTVRLYANTDCSGSPVATVPASALEAGVEVTVSDNATTNFSATSTTVADNTSGCSEPLSYVEDSAAPNTAITDKPASPVNASTVSFSFTGDDTGGSGVASFECRLESSAPGAWEACTSAKQYSNLGEGSHKFEVRAIDNAGNPDATPATYQWSVDTKAPDTQITDTPASLVNVATASFSFTGEDPASSGVASFECRLDSSAPSAWAVCGSPKQYTDLTEGSHKFEVRAIDNAGNADSTPATYSWTIDLTAPSVSVNSGPSGLTNNHSPTFGFGSEPNATFECSIDTGTPDFGPCSSASSHTPSSPLSDGSYTFRVRATDQAGNQAVATRGFQVDTVAPGAPQLSATVPASPANQNNPKVVGSAPAGTTIRLYASADCSGTPVATVPVSALEAGVEVTVADNSTTSFSATSTTPAENTSGCSTPLAYVEDSAAPQTQITDSPTSLVRIATADFSFAGDDTGGSGVASFQCRLDSNAPAAWAACASPKPYADLTEGGHKFEVRAIDNAGNADSTPATYDWTIDLTPPTVSVNSGPSGLTNDSTPSFGFGSEPGATFECSIDSGSPSFGPCSDTGSHTPANPLSDGPHTFRVRATDQAGNQAVATRGFQVDTAAPQAPELNATVPASPANENNPKVLGSAPAGTTVRLYANTDCSGLPVATVPASALEAGVEVTVSDNATTSFSATATTAADNTSGCSAPLPYLEDSAAPQTQIADKPALLVNVTTASFTFGGEDPGGSGVASLQCRIDSAAPGDWGACTSAKQYSDLSEGSHTFEVRAIDNAGNNDASPASYSWTIDLTPPTVSVDSGPSGLTNDSTPTFGFGSEPNATFECSIDTGSPAFGPCSDVGSHTPANPLGEGPHTFRVRATDQAGNQAVATRSFALDATEPSTQITDKPASLVKVATASFSFSGDDTGGSGVASFQCRLDSNAPGAWGTCASAKQYSDLTEGTHKFEVRAVDNAGNADATPAVYSWTVDLTAPTVSVNSGPSGLTNNHSPTFGFGSEPNATFECSIDTGTPDFGPCSSASSHTPSSPLSDGSYTFRVRATDQAGNQAVATRGFQVDTVAPGAPQLSATVPASPANQNNPKVVGSAPAGTTIRLYASADCSGTPVATVPVSALEAGVEVTVADNSTTSFSATSTTPAENTSGCSTPLAYVEDSAGPGTQITGKPASLVNATSATFVFAGDDTGGSGVASFQCRLDSNAPAAWEACASPKQYADLAEGSHKFEARAIDNAGNADATPALYEWSVDAKAPQTQITANPAALTNSSASSFSFSGDDTGGSGIASFECRRDSNDPEDWAPCASPRKDTSLAEGAHTFEVRATDNAGNVDQTPASFAWTIDSKAPQTAITGNPAALANSTTAIFVFAGDDTGGSGIASFECRRDSGQWQPCGSPRTYTGLSVGTHSFEVRATDVAGNVDSTPAAYEWEIDANVPEAPQLSATIPASPSSDNTPLIVGSAPAGTTVRLYSGQDCEGSAIATETAEDLAAGIEVTVADDSTTSFRATSTTAADNTSNCSEPLIYVEDSTAPQTQVTANPAALANVATASFAFAGDDPGGSGVASFECRLDSSAPSAWEACTSAKQYADLAEGSHKFEVRAIDEAGNADATPATNQWQIDLTPPAISINSGPAGLTNDSTPAFTFDSDVGASFQCSIDSGAPSFGACSSAGSHTAASPLADGPHTFRVRATDPAGNQAVATRSFTVDASEPGTQITAKPSTLVNVATAGFSFTGDDTDGSGVAAFQCRLDSTEPAAWEACTSPKAYANLADGPHSFEVRAVDNAGNADASPAAFQWTVDTSAPQEPVGPDASDPTSSSDEGEAGLARFLRVRRNAKEGTARLVFDLPGPGVLSLRAEAPDAALRGAKASTKNVAKIKQLKELQKSIKPTNLEIVEAGQAEIPVELTPFGKKLLQRDRILKLKVVIRFKSDDGSSAIWKVPVTLKKVDPSAAKRLRQPQ